MLRMLVLMLCLVVPLGCKEHSGLPAAGADATPPEVVTTFYPTRYFAQRISGGLVRVDCAVPPDADPIFWQPDRAGIERMQRAGLIVVNGAGYEQWLATAALPLSRLCDTAANFEGEFISYEAVHHSHGAGGEHSHEGVDGHTWMDPVNAARQAEAISIAMARRWPQHEKAFRDNHLSLGADLAALAARFEALRIGTDAARIVATHPAFNYPAKRYGWPLKNVDLPPHEPPTPAAVESLRARIASYGPANVVLLFESEPIPEVRASVLGAGAGPRGGVQVVVFEPAEVISPAREAAGENYLTIMHANIDRLAAALGMDIARPTAEQQPLEGQK